MVQTVPAKIVENVGISQIEKFKKTCGPQTNVFMHRDFSWHPPHANPDQTNTEI